MPRYRSNERDESNGVIYKDVCNPITAEFREELYKPYLTIDEATAYTGIGREKLREMTRFADCPFVLWVGKRRMIKRELFDEYIEKMYEI